MGRVRDQSVKRAETRFFKKLTFTQLLSPINLTLTDAKQRSLDH